MTPKRRSQIDENGDVVRRTPRVYSRRIADGDIEALSLITGLGSELNDAIAQTVKGLRAQGYYWPKSAPGSGSPARPRTSDGESGERARYVPDEAAGDGNSRSLPATLECSLTWTGTSERIAAYVLLSGRSRIRVAVGAQVWGLKPQ